MINEAIYPTVHGKMDFRKEHFKALVFGEWMCVYMSPVIDFVGRGKCCAPAGRSKHIERPLEKFSNKRWMQVREDVYGDQFNRYGLLTLNLYLRLRTEGHRRTAYSISSNDTNYALSVLFCKASK